MNALLVILTIIQVIAALFLIAVILLQSGKSAGLGAIAGGADTFMSRNKAKGWDAKLAKGTKWVAVVFMVVTFLMNLL